MHLTCGQVIKWISFAIRDFWPTVSMFHVNESADGGDFCNTNDRPNWNSSIRERHAKFDDNWADPVVSIGCG